MMTERTFDIKKVTIGLVVGLLVVIGFITAGYLFRGNEVNAQTYFGIEAQSPHLNEVMEKVGNATFETIAHPMRLEAKTGMFQVNLDRLSGFTAFLVINHI